MFKVSALDAFGSLVLAFEFSITIAIRYRAARANEGLRWAYRTSIPILAVFALYYWTFPFYGPHHWLLLPYRITLMLHIPVLLIWPSMQAFRQRPVSKQFFKELE